MKALASLSTVALLAGLLVAGAPVHAAGLCLMGNCSATIGAAWLVRAEGQNASLSYLSGPSQVLVSVTGMSSGRAGWRVDVRREAATWPQGVRLWVKRTGDGMGGGRVFGGQTFQEITDNGTLLCTGTGDQMNVPLQLKITGISFSVPVGTYMTAIAYSLITFGE